LLWSDSDVRGSGRGEGREKLETSEFEGRNITFIRRKTIFIELYAVGEVSALSEKTIFRHFSLRK
jgi:hypothetical protein